VLAAAAVFVSLRLRADLDEELANRLRSGSLGSVERDEGFKQSYDGRGRLVGGTGGARGPVLDRAEVARARRAPVALERRVPGIEGEARILARPAAGEGPARVAALGLSLDDRDEAVAGVVRSFVAGGAVAVVLASLIGYGLATAGLRPVEAMRRRAAEMPLTGDGDLLPLAPAHDEVRRLGETLNGMIARLRGAFERERRFVGDASHELRTPIAVVRTELESVLRSGDFGPGVREALVAAVRECDHLAQLAEDLLVVARAADGALPVRRERLLLEPLLHDVAARFSARARAERRRLRVDVSGDVCAETDALRIRQAIGNLVDNALRHGAGEVVLGARADGPGVVVTVADAGPGFAPEIAPRAFERFAQADGARGGDSTGLGLAIVRAIAEAHGGRAEISAGRGAQVRLWLPGAAAQGDLRSPSHHARLTVPRTRGRT